LNAVAWPVAPIRLSVPASELRWLRYSWALLPSMILAASLIVGLVSAVRLGFAEGLEFALGGFGMAACLAVVQYFGFRWGISRRGDGRLCEAALLYHDRLVLVCDGHEIAVPWRDVVWVYRPWRGTGVWVRYPIGLKCRVDGDIASFCFFPRTDREFEHWGLGDPFAALSTLSGKA
jgi:hypothetical protein